MKIGMVLWSEFPPDIRVKREARYLIEKGHDVHIICKRGDDQLKKESIDGIKILRGEDWSDIAGVAEELTRHMTLISPSRHNNLRKVLQEEHYDVVHVHDLPPLPTVLRALRATDIPIVADFHELYPETVEEWRKSKSGLEKLRPYILFKPRSRLKRVERKCIKDIDGLITVSPEQLEYYQEDYDLSEVETGIVRNVPDIDRLRQMPVEELNYEGFVVGYVGGFTPQRGLETAIKSFSELLGTVPDATLLMVGDSSDGYINNLKKLTVELGIKNNVEFTGWVDFEEVPSYMKASDVTLCTWTGNNIDSECTLPNKLFQSMFMETPVIVSDLRSMRNVVEETDCGLIFEPGSESSLTDAMLKLYKDPELRHEMGENGKRAVKNRYNINKEGETIEKIYERVNRETLRRKT